MKLPSKNHLRFSRTQRTGLFSLFGIIVIFQITYFGLRSSNNSNSETQQKQQWLSMPMPIDSTAKEKSKPKIYPFNPNFITDFKGYTLGMSVEEIDRLLEFRKTNRYVNSAEEFQQVTKVSDSLLQTMAPYFKFPDWVKNKKNYKSYSSQNHEKKITKAQIDINQATAEDLKAVYGIGDGLSERILKEKEKLGGFMSMEQMKDIWGLSPEVIANLNKSFKVSVAPDVKKLQINSASIKELSQFPYFKYQLAKSIVTYRSMNGEIKGIEDLIKISGFPIDKVDIIALYLEF